MKLATEVIAPSDRDQLVRAKDQLSQFLQDARDEPNLETISLQVNAKQEWVVIQLGKLDALEETQVRDRAAEARDREDRARFQKFHELRQQAQLFAAITGDQLSPDRLKNLRAAAHEALAIYAKDPKASVDAWTLADSLPTALKQEEKTRLRDGCYDLLLILTQEEADSSKGLRLLDRAVGLRPELTAAYHLRRADCLGRLGDIPGRDRAMRAAEQTQPETALDFFLKGRELAFRGRFADAIGPLDMAVQRDLDQTSAHLLLAICYLNKRPRLLERGQDQPERLHQEQSRTGGPLPVARLDLPRGREPGPRA